MGDEITGLLGVDAPIVLGPFGGLSSVTLTAAVSELGGLGSYGLYGYSGERILETAAEIRDFTSKPFALNLWLPLDEAQPADISPADYARYAKALEPFFDEVGIEVPPQPAQYLPPLEEQLEAVWEAEPAVLSVVFGVPSATTMKAARARGILVVGTATTVAEARALEAAGVDAIVATGLEAAGHRVSFLRPAAESLVGTFALIPQVVDEVEVPVIAAGGVADRRGVRAAFALRASGVQVGTAFLATRESAINDAHRRAIRTATDDGTVLTDAASGRLARGIPNRMIRAIESSGVRAPFPVQNWLTGRFRAAATAKELGELQSLWAGQAARLAVHDTAREVFQELQAGLPG